jgi:hypothetical protein
MKLYPFIALFALWYLWNMGMLEYFVTVMRMEF